MWITFGRATHGVGLMFLAPPPGAPKPDILEHTGILEGAAEVSGIQLEWSESTE
jgi:hypothetical protein